MALYEDALVKILRTKNLKGHKERIMVLSRKHIIEESSRNALDAHMIRTLQDVGKEVFKYTYKFVIVSTDFATIPDHPHFIASDLEPAEDYEQLLGTRWLKVIDVRPWGG